MNLTPLWPVLVAAVVAQLSGPMAAAAQQPLTEIMPSGELRETIQRWQKARGAYYTVWYGREFSVGVDPEATGFLVEQYAGRRLPADLAKDKQMAKAVVQTDVQTILNRSESVAIVRQQGGIVWFMVKQLTGIRIMRKDVEGALQAEACNVIPCPPDKCDPNTCTSNAYRRYTTPPTTPGR